MRISFDEIEADPNVAEDLQNRLASAFDRVDDEAAFDLAMIEGQNRSRRKAMCELYWERVTV